MKLISLNTWGGKAYQSLINFIKNHSQDTDIFCFQEVFSTTSDKKEDTGFRVNLYEELTKILSNHQGYYSSTLDNYLMGSHQKTFTDYNLKAGLAIFVNKKINVKGIGDFFVYRKRNDFNIGDSNTIPRNVQYVNLLDNGKEYLICNIHGIWVKEGKGDTDARITQSNKIKKFLNQSSTAKILCGDFNLDINTKSIRMLESGLTNLIRKYNIATTRSKFFPGADKYADFVFISSEVKVKYFQVPDIEISDHLPMILDFS